MRAWVNSTFAKPDDLPLDTYYAQPVHAHASTNLTLLNRAWEVARVVEPGKLAHLFAVDVPQNVESSEGKLAQIYLKLDNPANTTSAIDAIKTLLPACR